MSWTPSSSSERTIASEPVMTVGGTTLFGPRTGETAAESTPASAGRSTRSGALWAPVDLVAISEGLIGDPLLIGLFLCGSSVMVALLGGSGCCVLLVLREIKKPLSRRRFEGLRVTVRYQSG